MDKTLTVILGAGASFDCGDDSGKIFYCDREWRPPLTNELFQLRSSFDPILAKYPKAVLVAGELREKLAHLGNISLENFLKDYSENKKLVFKKNFRQIPFYLQELIGEVSQHYIPPAGSSMYERLVTYTERSSYSKILFITLNYDLFLDRALQRHYDHTFSDMSSYIPKNQSWFYVKLHGSVNWGQKIINISEDDSKSGEWTSFLIGKYDNLQTTSKITLLDGHQENSRQRILPEGTKERFYPCIAVPVEGKYPQTCPSEHLQAMDEFLRTCTDFLIVGCRLNDQDLLDHLKNVTSPKRIAFVNGSLRSASEAFDNLKRKTVFGKYQWDGQWGYDFGFRRFIMEGYAENFFKT